MTATARWETEMNDYKSAFNAAAADLSAIIALLGFTKYPGVDPVLRAITDLILEKAENQVLREERDAANKRADTLEHRMMGMMTRHFAETWRNRDTEKALDGYLSAGIAQLEQERDAALARVAELEACGAPALLAAADYFAERAKGPSPGWVTLSAVAKELRVRADKAPVAKAQHSVPEASEQEKEQGWTLDYRFVERVTELAASRTEYTTSMEATEQVLLAARELLAAAPGKEGV